MAFSASLVGGNPYTRFRRVVEHFFQHSEQKVPDLTRATNIGYLTGTNVTRALVFRAYRPDCYWVRVEKNSQITKHAMNPVREADVARVLEALDFMGESRWIPSAADTAFGMPSTWNMRWATMGGGYDKIYFARFDKTVRMLSPIIFHRAFKKANRIGGVNEFLGALPYTEERYVRLQAKFQKWLLEDGKSYRMHPLLLKRLGYWCSAQALKDLGLEPSKVESPP